MLAWSPAMSDRPFGVAELQKQLGFKPLNRRWAKLEIVFGLAAAALGLILGTWGASRAVATDYWQALIAAWLLLVLGGYLAMAGSRSHLYQSNNELTACLIDEIKQLKDRIERNEHSGR
jgi:hypothetical protein